MVTTPMPPPTWERRREYDRARAVGMFLKDIDDNSPPEKGVSRISPRKACYWSKTARRYRYSKGMVVNGKNVGGRFVKAPDDAPPERKSKGK